MMSHANGEKPSLEDIKNVLMAESIEEAMQTIDDNDDEEGGSDGNGTPVDQSSSSGNAGQAIMPAISNALDESVMETTSLEGTKSVQMVEAIDEPNASAALTFQGMVGNDVPSTSAKKKEELLDLAGPSFSMDDAIQASKRKLIEGTGCGESFSSKRLKTSPKANEESGNVSQEMDVEHENDGASAPVEVNENLLAEHFGNEVPMLAPPSPPSPPDIHEEIAGRNPERDDLFEMVLAQINRAVGNGIDEDFDVLHQLPIDLANFVLDDDMNSLPSDEEE